MKLNALRIVLLTGLLVAPLWGNPGRYGGVYGTGYGGVVGFSYSRGGLRLGGGFGPHGPPPLWRPYSSLTVVSISSPPPVVVLQAPPIIIQVNARPRDLDLPPVPRVPPPPEVPRVPDLNKPPMAKDAAKKPAPPPKRDDKPDRLPDVPAELPEVEHARLVKQGREAFAGGGYGLAARRFRAATLLRPDVAEPYFLLAQALIAQGKYHDASEAVVAGLAKAPDWPTTAFRPRDLYEDGADLAAHVARLDQALRAHPGDSVLLFLKGHLAWFAGDRPAATEALRRALPRFRDKAAIERYLGADKP